MSTRSDTPVFCDESGTRSAILQWSARGAVLLVLLLCMGLALTLDTQVRLPGLSRLLQSTDIGFGRPQGPATVAVPADPKAPPAVREVELITADTDDRTTIASDTEKRSATTSPTTAARKAGATTSPAAKPTAHATSPVAAPPAPAPEPTTSAQRHHPGQVSKPPPSRAQPTTPADSRANGHGQDNGLAKGKGKEDEVPAAPGADPTIP